MSGFSTLAVLGVLWIADTAVLMALIIYRSVVGIHEQNRIYLARGEAALEKDQLTTQKHIGTLDASIKIVAIASGALLLILGCYWFYQGIYAPPS